MNGLLTSPDRSGIATLLGTGFGLLTIAGATFLTAVSAMTVMVG